MSQITKAWIEAQIEKELERGNHPDAVRDLAALITVKQWMCADPPAEYEREVKEAHTEVQHHHGNALTKDEAEEWVHEMRAADGSRHVRWPLAEIRQYAGNFGVRGEDEVIAFFAVMNALYTDYGMVAQKYGVDKVDFWADMAKAFMHDVDAKPGKVRRYYDYIVDHD